VNRRVFLAGAVTAGSASAAKEEPIPVIDTHIHLFDVSRPQGVPWPDKNSVIYKTALPDRYRSIAVPLGIKGAIEIECSPWLEDNQWVLDVAAKDPIVVGTIGHLDPGTADFKAQLDRFHRNPLFLGIRCGNLWGKDMGRELPNQQYVSDLKYLASAGLALDIANPNPALLADVVRLTNAIPNLRVIIDHLPRMDPVNDPRMRAQSESALRELAAHPQVYMKLSGVLRRVDGRVPLDLNSYRPGLDHLWDLFGENRVIFGSDWPNSDLWGSYQEAFGVARPYVMSKGRVAAEKVFWKNSVAAYRWRPRDRTQPRVGTA
jgi:predicted TIM-barrel fold metal-dependent hydrolase